MSRIHTYVAQWGMVSGIRQDSSDLIIVAPLPSRFAPEARKGQMIIAVEAEGDVSRGRNACALVAKTIREAYYADGSVSITSSLRKALKAANAALYQFNFEAPPHQRATVGVTCAIFHGHDLFVTQVAPTQAYVAHAGKLRGIPNPLAWTGGAQGGAALGASTALGTSLGAEPEFFRSVLQAGDSVVLTSSNIARLLGKQQAEQLICFSDATTVAEALYELCRRSHLPEAHAAVIEIMPELSAAARSAPLSATGVSERSRLAASRIGDWVAQLTIDARRGNKHERPSGPPVAAPVAEVANSHEPPVVTEEEPETPPFLPPSHQGITLSHAPAPAAETNGLGLIERVPVGDLEPLPYSAFIGEGGYGGVVRPPAVKRDHRVDLGDNSGVPVDFAALPKKAVPPPPGVVESMTLPVRSALVGMLGGIANARRRTIKPSLEGPATRPRARVRGLSYRRERPSIPWLGLSLLVGALVLLVVVGLQQNRKKDQNAVDTALGRVTHAVAAAEVAPSESEAQQRLVDAETALRDLTPLKASGALTETKKANWTAYQAVLQRYDKARSSINRIGVFDDIQLVATLPITSGQISRIVMATDPTTITGLLQDQMFVLDVGQNSGTLYQLSGDKFQPALAPGQDAGAAVAGKIHDVLWRLDNPIALDRDENPFNAVATAFLRGGDGWLANRLQGSELLPVGEIPAASFGGNLYLWDTDKQQLMKYTSGQFGDLPTPWIGDRKDAQLDQVVGVQIDGDIYLLRNDGSVVVFRGGVYQRTLPVPKLAIPVQSITHFYVTPSIIDELSGNVLKAGYIYLLDTLNERVIQISKDDGAVIQQMVAREHGQLNRLTDLQVDAARQQIFLANGDQVVRARLPEPPAPRQPRSPQATVTASP